jgi:preprotein translocase subunit SecA
MLDIGDKEEELRNNLVQIGTGEGKSITLGATAVILTLLGFDVRCACYNEYLSQRDYTAFRSLFDSLGLLEYIHYDTFNKLCEAMINENGDIRQTVEQLISTGSNNIPQHKQQTKRPKILLIDEVDVFF